VWNAALDVVNYRSFLIVYSRRVSTVNIPVDTATTYDLGPLVPGRPTPTLSHIPYGVALKDAARFETIGQDLNQQLQFGSAQLILTGGAVSLDGKFVRHVIPDRVEVHYTGRALVLEDVVFSNCTFVFENTEPGRRLGRLILASSPIEFKKVG